MDIYHYKYIDIYLYAYYVVRYSIQISFTRLWHFNYICFYVNLCKLVFINMLSAEYYDTIKIYGCQFQSLSKSNKKHAASVIFLFNSPINSSDLSLKNIRLILPFSGSLPTPKLNTTPSWFAYLYMIPIDNPFCQTLFFEMDHQYKSKYYVNKVE